MDSGIPAEAATGKDVHRERYVQQATRRTPGVHTAARYLPRGESALPTARVQEPGDVRSPLGRTAEQFLEDRDVASVVLGL